MKKIVCTTILLSMLISLCACAEVGAGSVYGENFESAAPEFSANLLKAVGAGEGENVIISPASVLIALAMTANGAKGETLEQMVSVLCPGMTLEALNETINALCGNLPDTDGCRVKIADSIWINNEKNRFTVNDAFIDVNERYYRAGVFERAFDDAALREINEWTKESTDGKINEILKRIDPDAVMFLVNAVAFDAKWQTEFKEYPDFYFTPSGGKSVRTEGMCGEEKYYIDLEDAKGFCKLYEGGEYEFVALLPDYDVKFDDFVAKLSGEYLLSSLNSAKKKDVDVYLPAFTAEYEKDLIPALIGMGMTDAFDSEIADLSGIGSSQLGNLYVGLVNHAAYINVSKEGTKASAATVVGIFNETSASGAPHVKPSITFNRPFVYMIVEVSSGLPLFIGTCENVPEIAE